MALCAVVAGRVGGGARLSRSRIGPCWAVGSWQALPVRRVLSLGVAAGLGVGLAVGLGAFGCGDPGDVSACHPMRKCVTLTCRDRLSKGRDSEEWTECVEWCRTSRGVPKGEDARCAERIGVLCVRDWYGEECVAARDRCMHGAYLDPDLGGC